MNRLALIELSIAIPVAVVASLVAVTVFGHILKAMLVVGVATAFILVTSRLIRRFGKGRT